MKFRGDEAMNNRFPIVVILLLSSLGMIVQAGPAADDPRVTPVVLAYRKVRPAVVNISTEKLVTVRYGLFGRDPFEDIFPSPFSRRVPVQSLGSGFLISASGFIITNAHVVRQAEKITVQLGDESKHEAKVISADTDNDLAVLKIEPPSGERLPFLPLGRSDDLMVGETVIAVGNAMGYANSVTTGIISATDRTLQFAQGVTMSGLIQTDAPINRGNSGGPLLNIKGELIGVNTAIRADAQNIGFAIPVDRLSVELAKLLDFERLNRVIFGASAQQRHGETGSGVIITSVRAGTPAGKNLKAGDRIIAINDVPVRQMSDYVCAMVALKSGQVARIKLIRDGAEIAREIELKGRPRPDGKALAKKLFGMTLRDITPQLARDLRLPLREGLLVVGIEAGSPAQKLGVEIKDVVFQMGKLYVGDLDALGTVLEDVKGGRQLRIGIVRGNVRAWTTITAGQSE